MKNFENLNGALVLVRPDLQDPAMQQGKIGIVTYARESDEIYVGLLNGAESKYDGNDLMLLKEKGEILEELRSNGSAMELNDFKSLYKIMLLQERGTSTALVNALEIAAQKPGVWDKALNKVGNEQALEISKTYSR